MAAPAGTGSKAAAGADSFIFRDGDFSGLTNATADVILDFNSADGDKIKLDLVDANALVGGNQAFSFIGTAAFTNSAGQLRFQQAGGDTYIYGDTNGDGSADFMIRLSGLHSLDSGDFLF